MEEGSYECKKCGATYKQEEVEMVNFECCDEEVTNLESEGNHKENSFDADLM